MIRRYKLDIDKAMQDQLDSEMFELAIDDYIWWEDGNQSIVTDNNKVVEDLEGLLQELDIEYELVEED